METITIPKENARKAYSQATGEFKNTLAILFGNNVVIPNPEEDYNNYADVCAAAGIDPFKSLPFQTVTTKKQAFVNGAFKLATIFEAFNIDEEGEIWEPDYTDESQDKHYPWGEWSASVSAFVCSDTRYTRTRTTLGARLCTNTASKAMCIAKKFNKEWNEFLNPQI